MSNATHEHVMTIADQDMANELKNEFLDLCLKHKANALVALAAARCAAECFESIISEQGGEVFTVSSSERRCGECGRPSYLPGDAAEASKMIRDLLEGEALTAIEPYLEDLERLAGKCVFPATSASPDLISRDAAMRAVCARCANPQRYEPAQPIEGSERLFHFQIADGWNAGQCDAQAIKELPGAATGAGEGECPSVDGLRLSNLPRVKKVPVASTWSCPTCNRQNVYREGVVSDPQNKCGACGQQVIIGAIRSTDTASPVPVAEGESPKLLGDAPLCPACKTAMRYEPDEPQSYEQPGQPAVWFCECGETLPVSLEFAPATAPVVEAPDIAGLYGVGGQVYTFIDSMLAKLQMQEQWGMAKRARELKEAIVAHDKEVDRITREVNAECRAEIASTATPSEPAATAAREIVTAWLWQTSESDQQRARVDIERRLKSIFAPVEATGEGVE